MINNTNISNISNDLKIANLDEQAKNFENDDVIARNEAPEAMPNRAELISKIEMPFAFADTDKNQTESDRQKEKSSAKKEMFSTFADADENKNGKQKDSTPSIENVKTYFLEQNFPEIEAIKFFNYFASNGWLVGGKTPMVDWRASAQNWILNAPRFISNEQKPNRAKHLNTGTDKDYSEPL